MIRKLLTGILCLLLAAGVLMPCALASEEAEPPLEVQADEAAAPSGEEGEPAAEGASLSAEEPVPEEEPVEAPVPEGDPDDPLYAKYMLELDGAGTLTWSDCKPRALKSGETLRRGIDVSSWQGQVNWTKVAAAGVEFVFIRAGFRSVSSEKLTLDARYHEYMRGAKAAGLKVGVYIFSQAITPAEAVEEAEYLLSLAQGYEIDLPLVFDLEHYTGGRFTNAKLSKRQVTDICLAFCRRIERAGYESMVYSNPSMLNYDLYPAEFQRLWLAHFVDETSYAGHDYEYWQCSERGLVDGIEYAVDLDYWFEPAQSLGLITVPPFADVKKSDWYYANVLTAYTAGVVTGTGADEFSPNETASRGQVVTMIYRMEGKPSYSAASGFTDLTQSYYKDAVNWAAEKGVVNGYSETEFRPGQEITREQLVTILYRMKGSPETAGDLSAYADAAKVAGYARSAMAWAIRSGIITGYEDKTLRPQQSAKRCEVCAILMRYAML